MASPDRNPDSRPLPDGWVTQFDSNYRAWFYVNTRAQPPVTTWIHPFGPPPPSLPAPQYTPPILPPSKGSEYSGPPAGHGGYYPSQGGCGSHDNQGSSSRFGGLPGGATAYAASAVASGKAGKGAGLLAGLLGGKKHGSGFGGGLPGQYAKPPKKSGLGGAGGLALGAGAGLLGGALIANSFDGDNYGGYNDDFDDGGFDGGGFDGGGFDF